MQDRQRLHRHPLFAGCKPEAIDAIASQGELLSYRPRQVLIRHGTRAEHIFVLLDGIVRILIPGGSGHLMSVKIFTAPAVFGEMETLIAETFIESVDALRKVEVLRFELAAFERIMAQHPRVARNLLVDVCRRFRITALNQAFVATETVEARLANLLLAFARVFGVRVAQGIQVVSDTLTAESLASGVAANEKSARRAIKRWIALGWILRSGRYFIICDYDALATLAGNEAPRLDHTAFGDRTDA